MKKIIRKYSGVIFFYLATIGMVLIISERPNYFESDDRAVTYALND